MQTVHPSNDDIADVLERVGELLEAQDANPFRIQAYRRAARVVEQTAERIAALADQDSAAPLEALPGVGTSIAASIREYVHTGRLALLDRLEGQVSPEGLFTTIPGVGDDLARRIHRDLHIDTLEELEVAAHNGRLQSLPGIGRRRAQSIRDSVTMLLNRSSRRRARQRRSLRHARHDSIPEHPPVDTVLGIDREYRQRARSGHLKTVTPRRFNPDGRIRLPIMHTQRRGWEFTALFSNTARAHDLGKTRDWVVIYFEQNGHEDQNTVVTEYSGPLSGKRVVRGREQECARYYAQSEQSPATTQAGGESL